MTVFLLQSAKKIKIFKGKPPARVFPLFKPLGGLKIHPFLRFMTHNRFSPSAEGDEGCAPSTAPSFLRKKRGEKELDFLALLVCSGGDLLIFAFFC